MPKIDWDEMTDLFKCQTAFNEMDKALAEQRGTGAAFAGFPGKEENMGLQLDSKEYNEFLRLINELAEEREWVRDEIYYLFCKNDSKEDKIRRSRILSAICRGKIKFQ